MADKRNQGRTPRTPVPRAARYPSGVEDPEQRRRWDYADGVARQIFGDLGEEAIFMAAVVLFESEVPTDESGRDPASD